jgi:hypothetical protein
MQGRDLDDADEWARSWTSRTTAPAEAAAALADRVAGISASASGADDAIRVTVGSTGALTDLRLDDRVRELPGTRLAYEIMQVVRHAQANLAAQVADAVGDTVGEDSETGRAVLDSFASRFPEPRDVPEPGDPGPGDPGDPDLGDRDPGDREGGRPVMPAPPFPRFPRQGSFPSRPEFPHQPRRVSERDNAR